MHIDFSILGGRMKAKAVIEVVAVFALIWVMIALIGLSPIGVWERQTLGFVFLEYAVMIGVTLLVVFLTRRDLACYGISLRNFGYHLNIAVTCFLPIAIGQVPLAFVNHLRWSGSLVMAVVIVLQLFVLGWILSRKPTRNESGMIVGAIVLIAFLNLTQKAPTGHAILGFIFYLFFLGPGEEILFRGYIQSRLNEVWGRPFRFFGVPWGWGLIVTSIIFGCMHVINIGSLIAGGWQLQWWWGFWTFFAGWLHGFLREKTGSVVAPAILHGLPQAILSFF